MPHSISNVAGPHGAKAAPPRPQVGYSAILFYGYVGVIGLALFAALKWWFKAEVGLSQVWCTYGARPRAAPRPCRNCARYRPKLTLPQHRRMYSHVALPTSHCGTCIELL